MLVAATCIALRLAVCRSKHESTIAPARPLTLADMPTTNTSRFHDDNKRITTHHKSHITLLT
jgi:hypothetical protein